MTVKQVQRYIKLNALVPELLKMVDEKKIAFTPAVELAFIKPKNQQYIAIAIEGQQSSPSLSQAQRMRDLDQKKLLNPDVIDGIMLEEKGGRQSDYFKSRIESVLRQGKNARCREREER
ncbi:hypothetical protein ACSE3M_17715 [Bacillus velezensis]